MSPPKTILLGLTLLGSAYASPSLHFDFPNTTSPTPFDIRVDPAIIDSARYRASTFRVSHGLHPGWSNEGAPAELMSQLAEYWSGEYDWVATQDRINELDHFATTVPGNRNYSAQIPLHFIHQQSSNRSAIPLLFLHGWTSTHLEWTEIIAPLSDAFHIIAPDLPGYGFSPAATQPGLGPREMGIAFDALMKQLGYDTYGIVITDLGWLVGEWMAVDVADSLIGHFTDFQLIFPTPQDLERLARNETTTEETEFILAAQEFSANHFAYSTVQAQKPLALSWAMADSPVGFAGWIWDLKYVASDGYDYSFDEIITETYMLWIQEPYTSMRLYVDFLKPETMSFPKSSVPAGVTQWGNVNGPFPKMAAFTQAPRDWAERNTNVTFFRRHEFGGHFPALSYPEEYAKDVRDFFFSLGE